MIKSLMANTLVWSWTEDTPDLWELFGTGWALDPLILLSELPTFCLPCSELLGGPDNFWIIAWKKN